MSQSLERGRGSPAPSVTEADHGSDHAGKRVLSHASAPTASSTPTAFQFRPPPPQAQAPVTSATKQPPSECARC